MKVRFFSGPIPLVTGTHSVHTSKMGFLALFTANMLAQLICSYQVTALLVEVFFVAAQDRIRSAVGAYLL